MAQRDSTHTHRDVCEMCNDCETYEVCETYDVCEIGDVCGEWRDPPACCGVCGGKGGVGYGFTALFFASWCCGGQVQYRGQR